jgi:HTH-type transcriptional regulator/antitoxin HigA
MTRDGLIPKKVWDKKPFADKATTAEVYSLAAELMIHPAIIVGRIRYEQNNYKLLSRHVGNKQIRKHFVEGL